MALTGYWAYLTAYDSVREREYQLLSMSAEDRFGELDEAETALVDGGFPELSGCANTIRLICRFEFLKDTGEIAAVLTTGDEAPEVIDAFVMTLE